MRVQISGAEYTTALGPNAQRSVVESVNAVTFDPGQGWTKWLDTVAAVMVGLEGDSGQKMILSGVPLPAMQGVDVFVIMAQMFTPTAATLRSVSGSAFAAPTEQVDADGKIIAGFPVLSTITWEQYLGGLPVGEDTWSGQAEGVTSYIRQIEDKQYTVHSGSAGIQTNTDNVTHMRQLMDNYQSAMMEGANAILSCGVNITDKVGEVNVSAFWTSVHRLATQIDVMQAVTATTDLQAIKNGLKGAKDATVVLVKEGAKAAGELGADVAGLAGEVAGNAFAAFWKNAGPMALIVTAIVAYVALR